MIVLALAGQKGGSCRTSLATSLAVIAELAGIRTVIFDLDPQGSAASWRDVREAEYPDVAAAQPARLPRLLAKAAEGGCGLAILDCPPNAENATVTACEIANFALLPMRPSPLDAVAMQTTVRLVRDVTKTPFSVVLSACPTNTVAIANEIAEALAAKKIPVCPVRIYHRVAYYSHANSGLTATEHDPKGKAAQELRDLFDWICKQTGLRTELQTGLQSSNQAGKPAAEIAAK